METEGEREKRRIIEEALNSHKTNTLKTWQDLAIDDYGLVAGECTVFKPISMYIGDGSIEMANIICGLFTSCFTSDNEPKNKKIQPRIHF